MEISKKNRLKIYFTHNSAVEKNDEAVGVFVSHQYVVHGPQVVSPVVDVVSDAHHFLVITEPCFPHLYISYFHGGWFF